MLMFKFLTRKSISFTLDKDTFDTITLHCTNYSHLHNTENSILFTSSYTWIIPSKCVVLYTYVSKERLATILHFSIEQTVWLCFRNSNASYRRQFAHQSATALPCLRSNMQGLLKIITMYLSLFSCHKHTM